MLVEEGLSALRNVPAGSVISVGNFDGLHLGHQRIVGEARAAARAADAGLVIVTFEPHPLTVLRPDLAPPRITSSETKRALLGAAGVDRLVKLRPSPDVLDITAEAFYAILRDDARAARLVEGTDFNFGKARGGNIDRLRGWCERDGLALTVVEDVSVALADAVATPVRSSLVRRLLAEGNVGDAAACLGRPYAVEGVVVRGEQRGRTIGFPTANLDAGDPPLLAPGVYAGRCRVDDATRAVALSIGTKPTFGGTRVTVEAYLLDYAGDLYGRPLSVDVMDRVRDQERFLSRDALVAQLQRDVERVRRITFDV